jgi:cytochrome c peroxidase
LPVIIESITGNDLVDEDTPGGANGYIKDEAAAILLGKALFWDTQVGSNAVACATCHYHGGADARETNQLSPGLKGGNAEFDTTASGGGGPNYTLNSADFPAHQLINPAVRNSDVLFDSDDVVSSQGTFAADFVAIGSGAIDECDINSPDPFGFHLNNINVRRVEPRNTPTVVNAAFNHRNFWDGRANNIFNGVDAFGQRNTAARVIEMQGANALQIQVAFVNGSLASQSVTPPGSDFEMSCNGRNFLNIGRKMVNLDALAAQRVHPADSVLGGVSAHPKNGLDGPGNNGILYAALIEAAIADRFWDSDKLFDIDKNEVGAGNPGPGQYTLMEANFSLIWGLALQAYERTLISDDAPYDQWAEAPGDRSPTVDNTKGILTEQQMRGMDLFFTNTIGERGNCSTCHQGPAFSTATFPFTEEEESGEFPEQEVVVERMRMGDGFTFIENLFRFHISGEGTVGRYALAGRAGSREMPNIYPATVGGDLSINGVTCKIERFLMNQDRLNAAPTPGSGIPPEPPGPSDYADYSTRDAVVRVSGCLPFIPGPPAEELEIRIVDGGPGNDTAEILPVYGTCAFPFPPMDPVPGFPPSQAACEVAGFKWHTGLPAGAICPNCYPQPANFGAAIAVGAIDGDFELGGPTIYDTAFYNIGVRPTAEDLGVGGEDPFGVPLSIAQQWLDSLLGIPGSDIDALESINFGRVAEPFNWYGDSVFFPGGMDGYAWMTHRLAANPEYPNEFCAFPFPPFNPVGDPPPPAPPWNQFTCELAQFLWFPEPEFINTPMVGEYFLGLNAGRGDDAIPAYDPYGQPPFFIPNVANHDAIVNMPTGINGAFKTPILRNVTLTAPYFHNGGQLTLDQVVAFYNRGGDFALENLGDLTPNIHPLGLDQGQLDDIVAFLETLTDQRVACEQAPFDHPEIQIADGARGNGGVVTEDKKNRGQSKDQLELIQAVGADGRPGNYAPCIDQENFLE